MLRHIVGCAVQLMKGSILMPASPSPLPRGIVTTFPFRTDETPFMAFGWDDLLRRPNPVIVSPDFALSTFVECPSMATDVVAMAPKCGSSLDWEHEHLCPSSSKWCRSS